MQDSITLFSYLVGTWRLSRIIKSHKSKNIKLLGTANFTISNDNNLELAYNEQINNAQYNLYNSYNYKLISHTNTISKTLINHNNIICSLRFKKYNKSIANSYYICGKDNYFVYYKFIGPGAIKIVYWVYGPNKNYKIITNLLKILK